MTTRADHRLSFRTDCDWIAEVDHAPVTMDVRSPVWDEIKATVRSELASGNLAILVGSAVSQFAPSNVPGRA